MSDVIRAILYSLLSLYMLVILLRWTAAWLEINLFAPRWAWVSRLTDPLLHWVRKHLPPMGGTFDWAPIATLLGVWIIRVLLTGE